MIKISVVIPVYNAERYIERCANSLFSQTLKEIEYIFVDDCSKDSSLFLINKTLSAFPHLKTQVKILRHYRNMGVAAARQTGITNASGEYIIHCDADDYVQNEAYELLYEKAKSDNLDILFFNYRNVYNDGKEEVVNRHPNTDDRKALVIQLLNNDVFAVLWGCLVRRCLYKPEFIWPIGNMCEDRVHLIQLCLSAERVGFVEDVFYMYYQDNSNSITKANNKERLKRRFVEARLNDKIIEQILQSEGFYSELKYITDAIEVRRLAYLYPYFLDKNVRELVYRENISLSINNIFNSDVVFTLKMKYIVFLAISLYDKISGTYKVIVKSK